jgi:hypothetical protein
MSIVGGRYLVIRWLGIPPGNPQAFARHSPDIPQAFPRHSPGIPQAFPRHSPGIFQAFPRHFPGIPQAFPRHSQGIPQAFPRHFPGIPKVFHRHSPGISQAFPRYSTGIPQAFPRHCNAGKTGPSSAWCVTPSSDQFWRILNKLLNLDICIEFQKTASTTQSGYKFCNVASPNIIFEEMHKGN